MMLRRRRRVSQVLVGDVPPPQFDTMAYETSNWLDTEFLQRIPRTINPAMVPSIQTDFPLGINNTFPELIGFSEAELRFASTDDMQLDYEIEKFDTITGELIVWLKKPTVDDGDIIYIYFDNPSAVDEQNSPDVWSNNFVAVQHMAQTSGNLIDSTGNNNDMTPIGTTLNDTLIGNAKNLPGVSDAYFALDNDSLDTTDITVSAWVNLNSIGAFMVTASKWFNPLDVDWVLTALIGELSVLIGSIVGVVNSGAFLSAGVKHHVAFTIVGVTTLNIYLDGNLVYTQAIPPKPTSTISRLQLGDVGTSSLQGTIDEFHMSNDGKSSDWIKTEYNNQNDDDIFYTTGAVELVPTVFDVMAYEPDNWFNAQFLQRIPFTINEGEVPTTLTDFPIKIEDTFTELIGKSQNELVFASTDDIQLAHEIDEFDTVTGYFIAWVKKPTVSDSDIIYAYFDKPAPADTQDTSAVWSNGFVAVYHLAQTSGNILDSTINGNDMTPVNSPTNGTTIIGNSKTFPAIDDGFIISDNDSLDTTDITVSIWVRLITIGDVSSVLGKLNNPPDTDFAFIISPTNTADVIIGNNPPLGPNTPPLSINDIHQIAFTIVGETTLNVYLDGVLTDTQTIIAKPTSSISSLEVGTQDVVGALQGSLDEFHMSNDGKSSDWIKTEYNNQRPVGNTFFTKGAVQNVPTTFDTMAYEVI